MIGAARYFAPRHLAPRYWMKVGETVAFVPPIVDIHGAFRPLFVFGGFRQVGIVTGSFIQHHVTGSFRDDSD